MQMRANVRLQRSSAVTRSTAPRRTGSVCKSIANPLNSTATTTTFSKEAATKHESFASVLGLVQWSVANKVLFTGCRPDIRNDARGVYATSDLNAGDNLVAVPLQASVAVQPGERCPFPDFIPQDVWVALPWYTQLACKLLHERALGPASRFADYLPALPPRVDLPVLWPREQVRRLQYPYLEEQILDEQQEWAHLYNILRPHLSRRGMAREDLHWAMTCVRSRTFAGPYFPTPVPVKLAAGAMAAAAVLAAGAALGGGAAVGTGGVDEGLVGTLLAGAAGLGVPAAWQAAEARRAQSGEPGTVLYSVCPFIDMFNHDSRSQGECVYAPWRSEFRVAAGEPYKRGQQVLINYGSQSNDALLQRYGFVQLEGNPHDRYVLNDLKALLERVMETGASGSPGAGSSGSGGVPIGRDMVRAAIGALDFLPGSLEQVPLTPGGIPTQTTQAVNALLSKVATQHQGPQPSAGAVLAAACLEELRAAPTTLEADEAALAQLRQWDEWLEAGARPQDVVAALVAEDSSRQEEEPGVISDALSSLQADAAVAADGSAQEPSTELPVTVLPPKELSAFGDEVDRYRTVLMFRIAKKRVLRNLV